MFLRPPAINRNSFGIRVKAVIVTLVGLLLMIAALSYISLQQLSKELDNFSQQTLPSLGSTIELTAALEEVVQNTARLMDSKNQAERRIAFTSSNASLATVGHLLESRETLGDAGKIRTILTILEQTSGDMNNLIDGRIKATEKLMQQNQDLKAWTISHLFREMDTPGNLSRTPFVAQVNAFVLTVTDLTAASTAREQRRIVGTTRQSLLQLEKTVAGLTAAQQDPAMAVMADLRSRLDGPSGIFEAFAVLRRLDLRSQALAQQMQVLVAELVRETGNIANEKNIEAQQLADSLVQSANRRMSLLLLGSLMALALAIASFIFLDRRVLSRLLSLRDAVIDRATGGTLPITVDGRDEVSEIASAVQHFIAEIDRRQTKLAEGANQLQTVLRLSPQAMCIVTDGQLAYHNDAFAALWTRDGQEATSWQDTAISHLPIHHCRVAPSVGTLASTSHKVTLSGADPRWFDIASSAIEWENRPARQLVVVETTKQMLVQAALEEARQKAEAAAGAKASFLAMMSHEIRSPMNGIISVAEMLARGDLGTDQKQLVDIINQSAETLLQIINDILDLSKIEAGKLDIDPRDFDLPAVITGVADLLRPGARDKGLEVLVELDPDLPRLVNSDPNRVRQILFNLLGNAVKFTETGHVRLRVHAILTGQDQATVTIMITDTGIGMDAETQSRLFQPFEQGDSSVARRYGGTGLGLSISKRLAALLGGDITLRSTVGAGSTFSLKFPVRIAADPPATGAVPETPATRRRKDARILVVEDNKINQIVIGKILKELAYDWDTADDGLQALTRLAERQYHLVLTDLRMPHMDGFTLARTIRAQESPGKRLPIIALSADAMEEAQAQSEQSGIDHFLAKPVKLADMQKCLAHFLKDT